MTKLTPVISEGVDSTSPLLQACHGCCADLRPWADGLVGWMGKAGVLGIKNLVSTTTMLQLRPRLHCNCVYSQAYLLAARRGQTQPGIFVGCPILLLLLLLLLSCQ